MASSKRNAKHKRRNPRAKKLAVVSAATVTTAALTVGMAPPPETESADPRVALMASPDYTQIIENSSDSLNNLLFAQANFTNALGAVLNPLAALTGGLLPSVGADVEHVEVDSLAGLVQALTVVLGALGTVPDLSDIPGLPPNAATDLADALDIPSVVGLGALTPVLTQAVVVLTVVDGLLSAISNNPLLEAAGVTVPSLDDVIDALGLTVEATRLDSSLMWPVLGINGTSSVTNIFAQLDGLTGGALVGAILSQLRIGDQPLPPALTTVVTTILTPLNALETPSITAWLPTASGNYTLPLGGSFGYLATMPTVAVGPIDVLGIEVPETVVAVPLGAGGVTLPLGLASFGTVATPGVVFPTATGVSTLLGTNLQSFAIPLLGTSYTSLNTLNSTYLGTNGFNYNSGQTVGLLTTPLGPLPIVYSLGKVNAGTTGFGFTGPSLFGVGLLPHLQVGTAPEQESPNGLIPADVLNLGLGLPTQLTSVTEVLGLPSPQIAINALVNPVFNATAAPVGALITAFLNENIGSIADGSSDFALRLTDFVRELSEGLPGAAQLPPDDEEADVNSLKVSEAQEPTSDPVAVAESRITDPSINDATELVDSSKEGGSDEQLLDEKAPEDTDADTEEPIGKAARDARAQADKNFRNAQNKLRSIAADGQKQINDTVKGVHKGLNDTAKQVGDGFKKAGDDVKKALGGDRSDKDAADNKDAGGDADNDE